MAIEPESEPLVVEQNGLALLHHGELIIPAPGSDAVLSMTRGDGTLVLEFPVEVEVRIVDAFDPEQHAEFTLEKLVRALDGVV